ncbi:MAG: ADP-ribosylglycohydrolase family protein [Spirochaetia bacterium]
MENRETFERMIRKGSMSLRRSTLFDTAPRPLPADFDWDRVEGMMLGLAIGDSLGNTSEGMLPGDRRKKFGEVRDYLPSRHMETPQGGSPRGYPSDDTQLAFWTLEQILDNGQIDPALLYTRFAQNRIFGIGSSVRQFLSNMHAGKPWQECATPSAGNGALMRIAPVLIPYISNPSPDLWVDTALCAMITHNDTASLSACLAFVHILWELLCMKSPPEPRWWVEQYISVARDLETGTAYRPRGGAFSGYSGPLWRYVEERLPEAWEKRLLVREACDEWFSGAYLLETVPSVLYILMCHGDDLEESIIRAVNDTKDNDTIAAIVGAAAGALHGKRKIPSRWVASLSGRTTDRDDGRAFEILDMAKRFHKSI